MEDKVFALRNALTWVDENTSIYTDENPIRARNLRVGDNTKDAEGKFGCVCSVEQVRYDGFLMLIETASTFLRCTEWTKFMARKDGKGGIVWIKAKDLTTKDTLFLQGLDYDRWERVRSIKVECCDQEVVGIQTEFRTYVANGLTIKQGY